MATIDPSSLDQPAQAASDPADSQARLDQVRELLFGDTARGLDERVVVLARQLEERCQRLDARIEGLEQELSALRQSGVSRTDFAATLRKLADHMQDDQSNHGRTEDR